jgi:hypothetical protein
VVAEVADLRRLDLSPRTLHTKFGGLFLSTVAMKVNCDLQLTLMASSLYRLLGVRIGNGYEVAESRDLFRHFVDATAEVSITGDEIVVRFQRRAHNPLLIAAGFDKTESVVTWLGNKRLRMIFG